MANPNIFAQYARPVRSMQEYSQDYDAAEQNKLALAAKRMQMQQAEAGMQDQQRIRGLASQYGSNPNKLVEALRLGGYFGEAGTLDKQIQEGLDAQTKRDKAGRDNSAADEKLFGDRWNNVRTFVGGINSPQGAEAYVRGIYADPVLGPRAQALQPLELALQEIPKDATTLPRWKAAMSAISAEKLIELTNPKMQTVNTGNAQVTTGYDQFSGQPMAGTGQTLKINPPPANPASDLMIPDASGSMVPNQPLINVKTKLAGAGATRVNVSNVTKQEGEESKAVGKFFGDAYAETQKAGFDAENKLNRYGRLKQLLDGVSTGTFTPTGLDVAKAASALGINIDPNMQNKEAAQALSSEIALQLRNPSGGAGMPGAMSDADRQFLANMVPGLATTPEGRKLMIETATKLAQRDKEVAAMARKYRQKKGNIDEGFYDELAQFSSAKPLFGKSDGGLSAQEQKELDELRARFGGRK